MTGSAHRKNIGPVEEVSSTVVLGVAGGEVDHGVGNSSDLRDCNEPGTSPNGQAGEGEEIKAGHNTKFTPASLQGLEQVHIPVLVNVDDAADGENDLGVDDIATAETVLGSVERLATASEEASNSDVSITGDLWNLSTAKKTLDAWLPCMASTYKRSSSITLRNWLRNALSLNTQRALDKWKKSTNETL